jgi:cell wall-associated NlpC family hydrolase
VEAKRLQLRERAMQRELAGIREDEKDLAQEKAAIEAKAAEADELLATLEAEQRQAMAQDQAPRPAQVSGNAAAVVDHALGQVGKPYVWAAEGPDSYDCSGLTMMAWAQAGVSLPHSASAQMSSGTPVSQSELRPGDLVFYYSPVSHVGIYIGNGQIVDAANPSTGVRVASVTSMPYSGAVRPG